MARGPSKVAGTGIGQGQLADSECGTGLWEEVGCEGDSREEIEGSGEFSVHFVLSKGTPQDKVERVVHPPESLAVAQQFHEECGTAENGHARDEFFAGNEVVETGKEETEGGVHDLAAQIGVVPILSS